MKYFTNCQPSLVSPIVLRSFFIYIMLLLWGLGVGYGQTYSGAGPISLSTPVGATNIQWYKDGATISGQVGTTYSATTVGQYYAIYDNGSCTAIKTEIVVVATDCAVGGGLPVTLTGSTSGIVSYKWYKNGAAIAGQTSANYTAITGGTYYVEYTSSNGCVYNSDLYYVFVLACPIPAGVGTVDCAKTQIAPIPIVGTASQVVATITVNVTTIGAFTLTLSGSGMSLANGVTSVTASTTGIQRFYVPLNYTGTALGTMNFTVGAAGTCSADLSSVPAKKKVLADAWTLDNCSSVLAGPSLK
jgi:hypothetical protein